MDQPARREVTILPKSTEQTSSLPTQPQYGARSAGTMFAWSKDTGEEVSLPEKRTQTKEEMQSILRARKIGACAECRAAKRKCLHVNDQQRDDIRPHNPPLAFPTTNIASSDLRTSPTQSNSGTPPMTDLSTSGMTSGIRRNLDEPDLLDFVLLANSENLSQQSTDTGLNDVTMTGYPGLTSAYAPRLNTSSYLVPPSSFDRRHQFLRQPTTTQSYANVVATGQTSPKQTFKSREGPQRGHDNLFDIRSSELRTSSNASSQQQRGPSYAQVVACGPSQGASSGFGSELAREPFGDTWLDDLSMLDPAFDFPLFDEPINRDYVPQTPFTPSGALVIDTSATLAPSQLLKSPAESVDSSSMTSSSRRSKREIMEGDLGKYSCRHCGARFNTFDDQRHHEERVHLPYESRKHACPHCGERFVFPKDLNRHLVKHEPNQARLMYFCTNPSCKYAVTGFRRKDHFKRHMTTHSKTDSAMEMSRSQSPMDIS